MPMMLLNYYKYRAAAFSGVRTFSGLATGGNRICSVIACTGDGIDTCGKRFAQYVQNKTGVFEELVITASVPTPAVDAAVDASDSSFFPVSLDVSIMPLQPDEYTYDVNTNGIVTEYSLTLHNFSKELYSVSVWGRVFATDGEDVSPPVGDSAVIHVVNILLLLLSTVILLLK